MEKRNINDLLSSYVKALVEQENFKKYKNNQFIKVSDDVLFYIKLYPNKNDCYFWYSVYPICQYKLWLGAGSIAGRLPLSSGELIISDGINIEIIKKTFGEILVVIFDFFKKRNNVLTLANSISEVDNLYPQLVKGICLAMLDKPVEAKLYLNKFYLSDAGLSDDKDGVKILLDAIDTGTHLQILENNKIENIKKLRLRKFME